MLINHKDLIVIANMMCLTYKDVMPFFLKGMLHECSAFEIAGAKYKVLHPKEHETAVATIALTTLNTYSTRKLPSKTFDELNAAGKLRHDDNTGELEVRYIRDVPVDLKGTCLVPMTAGISLPFLQRYEILGLGHNVIVDGKPTFTRIRIQKRKE